MTTYRIDLCFSDRAVKWDGMIAPMQLWKESIGINELHEEVEESQV